MEERPPVWRVDANILNKHSRRPTRGGTQRGGWTRCLKLLTVKTCHVAKCSIIILRTWADTLVRSKQWKREIRFCSWKVRSLYKSGSLTAVARELERNKLDLVGV